MQNWVRMAGLLPKHNICATKLTTARSYIAKNGSGELLASPLSIAITVATLLL